MMDRKTIKANDGMWLTNGVIYAKEITLGDWDDADNYYEITEEEYVSMIGGETDVPIYDE